MDKFENTYEARAEKEAIALDLIDQLRTRELALERDTDAEKNYTQVTMMPRDVLKINGVPMHCVTGTELICEVAKDSRVSALLRVTLELPIDARSFSFTCESFFPIAGIADGSAKGENG